MHQRTVVLGSAQGLHARPAKLFVQAAAQQPVRVLVSIGDRTPVRADSMIAVLTLGAIKGALLTLHADGGDDAEQALATLAALLEKDLDADG